MPSQLQNFNISAVVAPLVARTNKQSNGNYEAILAVKFLVF